MDDAEVPADGDRSGELARAKQALTEAYERARAGGYQSGTPAMRALGRAEQNYQQLRCGEAPDEVAVDQEDQDDRDDEDDEDDEDPLTPTAGGG